MPKVYIYKDEAYPVYGLMKDFNWGDEVEVSQKLIDEYEKVDVIYNNMQRKLRDIYEEKN